MILTVVIGCVRPDALVPCDDGSFCAPGRICDDAHGLCVAPEQLTACTGLLDRTPCSAADDGNCQGGVCLPAACANERLDLDEVCDDGNTAPGDGCGADCRSDEVCGDGKLEPIAGELCDDDNLEGGDGCSSRCVPEEPHWIAHRAAPPPRLDAAAAFDARRGVVVTFGGRTASSPNVPTGDTHEYGRGSWRREPVRTQPTPRFGHALAFDAARGVVVMFGGDVSGGLLADTWLYDGADWRRAPASGPAPRAGHALVHDARRGVVVLHGGRASPAGGPALAPHADTWEWDGTTWRAVVLPDAPAGAAAWTGAYDPVTAAIVFTDGARTFLYDGASWRPGPVPPQPAPHLTFDVVRQRVLLHGGVTGDVWALERAAWTRLSLPLRSMVSPLWVGDARGVVLAGGGQATALTAAGWEPVLAAPAVYGAAAAFDAARGHVVVVGGERSSGDVLDETWLWTPTGWRDGPGTGTARTRAALAYDAARGAIVLHGGISGFTRLGDTWTFDGTTWTLRPGDTPGPREGAAIAYDARRGEVVLFGGRTDTLLLDDATWTWDGATWTRRNPATSPPAHRYAGGGYDPLAQHVLIYGGVIQLGSVELAAGDAWTWDGTTWTAAPGGTPRTGPGFAWSSARRALVLGGGAPGEPAREWTGATSSPVDDTPPTATLEDGSWFPALDGAGVHVIGGLRPATQDASTAHWQLRRGAAASRDACTTGFDSDGDGATGCADPDCAWLCAPACPPGATCDPLAPRCGDGVCSPLEATAPRACPADACPITPVCGDLLCDAGETGCPGDCP